MPDHPLVDPSEFPQPGRQPALVAPPLPTLIHYYPQVSLEGAILPVEGFLQSTNCEEVALYILCIQLSEKFSFHRSGWFFKFSVIEASKPVTLR